MNMEYFSVFDSAAGAYLEPFPCPTIEVAIRRFREAIHTPDHQFQKFPEDYTLFHVGSFDQSTGKFTVLEPRSLGVAMTFLTPSTPLKAVNDE